MREIFDITISEYADDIFDIHAWTTYGKGHPVRKTFSLKSDHYYYDLIKSTLDLVAVVHTERIGLTIE